MSEPTPAEIEAVKVLIAHGRTRIEGCDCGWGMDGTKLGQSHALHVWRELQRAVLPDHDARVRADERERLTTAGWRPPIRHGDPDMLAAVYGYELGEADAHRSETEIRADERAKVAEEIARAIEATDHTNAGCECDAQDAQAMDAAIARAHSTGEDPT